MLQCGVTRVKCSSAKTVVCTESHCVHPVGVALQIPTQDSLREGGGEDVREGGREGEGKSGILNGQTCDVVNKTHIFRPPHFYGSVL